MPGHAKAVVLARSVMTGGLLAAVAVALYLHTAEHSQAGGTSGPPGPETGRLYAHVQQVGHANDRSYAYTYDHLSRLRQADLGELVTGVPDPYINPQSGVPTRYHTWTPDLLGNPGHSVQATPVDRVAIGAAAPGQAGGLSSGSGIRCVQGNWTGDPNDPNFPYGLQVDIDADGNGQSEDWITTIHDVNPANQITQITRDDSQAGEFVKQPVYDRAGNLVWDGRYFFQPLTRRPLDAPASRPFALRTVALRATRRVKGQYDGFNRLVQVNATTAQMEHGSFDADGRLTTYGANFLGLKLAAFTYDGLGRLIRTERWRSGRRSWTMRWRIPRSAIANWLGKCWTRTWPR